MKKKDKEPKESKKHEKLEKKVGEKEVKVGIKVEKEHQKSIKEIFPKATKEQVSEMIERIALDHLAESEKYYKELAKMEKKLKK